MAHHAFLGEMWDKAVQYGRLAGGIAAERSASAQAAMCFDQAFRALARLPETRETLEHTLASGEVTYWSRSRQKVWKKGETSGHTQRLVEAFVDCGLTTLAEAGVDKIERLLALGDVAE